MRKFDPLPVDHFLVGEKCPVCKKTFVANDETTLIATIPANSEEAKKAQVGLSYNSHAEAVHWVCRN